MAMVENANQAAVQGGVYEEVVVNKRKRAKKAKPPKEKKQKKEVVLNHGITGAGTDYTVYVLSTYQKLLALMLGTLIGFVASYVYFGNETLSLIVGLIAGYKSISIYRGMLQKKRLQTLRLQFRDLLESLSNSYTVGMTSGRAFRAAYDDMVAEHGKDAYITQELQLLCLAHDNQGLEIKDLLNDFAQRSGIDDIRSFASVFEISSNLGGNVAKVIRETRDMISDKIEVELDIQTMVTGQKNQLNVLAVMPFVIVLVTKAFDSGTATTAVIIVKFIALIIFVFAYWLGTRIVDIKV